MFWENTHLTMENRIHISKNFLKSYLLLFNIEKNYESFRIFQHIQEMGVIQNIVFEKYSLFLTSFINFFTNNNTNLKQLSVKNICFEKFIKDNETCTNMFENANQMKDMDDFISWIFAKE